VTRYSRAFIPKSASFVPKTLRSIVEWCFSDRDREFHLQELIQPTQCKNHRSPFYIPLERRRFLKSVALISAGFTVPGYLAEALTLTPSVTQGPFYPARDQQAAR
jgi:hypothetical protein